MPSVPISTSRQLALDRVGEVLLAQYATELAAVQDANLYLPAPDASGYFQVPMDPDEVIHAHNVAVFIYPAGPRTHDPSQDGSGGRGVGEMQKRRFPVDVTVLCRRGLYDKSNPVKRNGKALTSDEVLRLRAERYTGAMIECVLKYVCKEAGIVDVDLEDDMPDILFDEQAEKPMWGIATANFTLTQKVRVPLSRSLP